MARRSLRGAEQVPDSGVPVPALALEQKATARANATVIQAGRDVITGDVFVGRFARLRDVWLDPAPVFEEVGVDRFVGREWLIESVDQFLRSSDRGYVVVQAHAGLGKTAFAAWLARSRDWPCHFTRRRKGRVATTALRNLAAQLVARYGLVNSSLRQACCRRPPGSRAGSTKCCALLPRSPVRPVTGWFWWSTG
jgi:hypothetical protein